MKIGSNNAVQSANNILNSSKEVLRQATKTELKNKSTGSASQNSFDRNGLNFHQSIGGADFDYTKEDAIMSAWNKKNGFNLYDILNGNASDSRALGITKPSDDFVESLKTEGLSTAIDWFAKDLDFKSLSIEQLKQSIDFLASQFAVTKEHINTNFIGEHREAELSKLTEKVDTYKQSIAQSFADEVGSFLETGDSFGEKEKIYQSVINEFNKRAQQYEKFTANNINYAHVEGDEWLKNDLNFMASELRKSVSAVSTETTVLENGYTLDELESVQNMVNEIKGYGLSAHDKNSVPAGSEEEIGIKLAELSLKAAVFNDNSNVSDSLKSAITKSVDSFIKKTINDIDNDFKRKAEEALISADKKGYSPLNKSAISAVIDTVMANYKKTGSASKAMKAGANFAVEQYTSKRNDNGEIYRYKGDAFRNFYNISDKKNNKLTSDTNYAEKPYLENLINSFNTFVGEFNLGNSSLINKSDFSALV